MTHYFRLKNKLKLSNRRGSILVFILIIFLVISIVSTSVLYIYNTNLKQAKYQQDALEAYYLAYSGAEMAFAALIANGNAKLNELTRNQNPVSEHKENNIVFGNGKIDITAKKATEINFDGWIIIISTGTLSKNNQTFTRSLYFNPSNPVEMVWKNN